MKKAILKPRPVIVPGKKDYAVQQRGKTYWESVHETFLAAAENQKKLSEKYPRRQFLVFKWRHGEKAAFAVDLP